MKAISLWQPYASFISLGLKKYETRSRGSNYRGELLICSARKTSKLQARKFFEIYCKYHNRNYFDDYFSWCDVPFGKAITVVTATNCNLITQEFIAQQSKLEIDCGDWQVGRWAWKLENIKKVREPFPVLGKQGFFNVDVNLIPEDLEEVI